GLAVPYGPPDERLRTAQVFGVAVAPDIECQLVALGHLRFAALDFHHAGHRIASGVIPRVVRPQGLVVGARRPVPFLEAPVGGPVPRPFADVPLSVDGAGVPALGQQITQRLLPGDQAPAARRPERDTVRAGADRVPPRQQR